MYKVIDIYIILFLLTGWGVAQPDILRHEKAISSEAKRYFGNKSENVGNPSAAWSARKFDGRRSSLNSASDRRWLGALFSLSYNTFTYTSSSWREHYDNISVELDSIVVLSGIGGAFGFWVKEFLLLQVEGGYFYNQRLRAKYNDVEYAKFRAEGISWNLASILTFPIGRYVTFDVGGGYSGHHLRIRFFGQSELGITRNYYALTGFRVGQSKISVFLNNHFLFNAAAIKGYHMRVGISYQL
ncbi:MAG: hypothetical protein ACRBF0_15180 [Calditrichia bacterium]